MTSVTIVIALYNQLAFTRQCIDSLKRYSPDSVELILVDNGRPTARPIIFVP